MSPIVRAAGGGERRRRRMFLVRHCCALQKHKRHKRDGCMMMTKKKQKKQKQQIKPSDLVPTDKLELEADEANKTLYLCFHEEHWDPLGFAIVVRTITLSDLFSYSDDPEELELRQVAYKGIPQFSGCGVFGSQIVFAGGVEPSLATKGYQWVRSEQWDKDVYSFSTENNTIRKMEATLQQGKYEPMLMEIDGKLYALSYRLVSEPPSFEVFDPEIGTKMFVSHRECPVFCFDVAHPDREWRLVSTMCDGECFPFYDAALVLDLPEQDNDNNNNKKLVFGYNLDTDGLEVYVISLEENQESLTRVGYVKLPMSMLPYEFGNPGQCFVLHIGGQKGCLVLTRYSPPRKPKYKPGTHKKLGMALPFNYEVDISKVGRDRKNSCTIQFMTPCFFQYHTNPSAIPQTPTPMVKSMDLELMTSQLVEFLKWNQRPARVSFTDALLHLVV